MRINKIQVDLTEATWEFELVLSRRNLKTLLAKLDGFPENSALTIVGGDSAPGVVVRAEEDDIHYGSRGYGPGPMHSDTEAAIK